MTPRIDAQAEAVNARLGDAELIVSLFSVNGKVRSFRQIVWFTLVAVALLLLPFIVAIVTDVYWGSLWSFPLAIASTAVWLPMRWVRAVRLASIRYDGDVRSVDVNGERQSLLDGSWTDDELAEVLARLAIVRDAVPRSVAPAAPAKRDPTPVLQQFLREDAESPDARGLLSVADSSNGAGRLSEADGAVRSPMGGLDVAEGAGEQGALSVPDEERSARGGLGAAE